MRELQTLLEGGAFFEGPRWRDGRWWVSDFFRHRVITVDPEGREEHVVTVEGRPSGLGWMPDGSLLIVSMVDQRILRWDGESLSLHADVSEHCRGYLNDTVVDAGGRAYAGEFGFHLARTRTRSRPGSSASTPAAPPRWPRRTCCSRTAR